MSCYSSRESEILLWIKKKGKPTKRKLRGMAGFGRSLELNIIWLDLLARSAVIKVS